MEGGRKEAGEFSRPSLDPLFRKEPSIERHLGLNPKSVQQAGCG